MKKIGILTLHYSDNYGAVLQVYALRTVINRFKDCKAEIINFVPDGFQYLLYNRTDKDRDNLIRKRKLFEKFLIEKCGINDAMISEVVGNDYDYYCVGSDQVWNTNFATEQYFLPQLSVGAKKVSYAASIGMNIEEAYQNRKIFEKYISEFRSISLREQEHISFIKDVCKKDCECVLDPTLLLSAEDYGCIISKDKSIKEPFIFFFWLNHDGELMKGVEFVNTLSRKYSLPIVHSVANAASYVFAKEAGCMIYEGVEDFLWYIKNAQFVVTNSYHATLFSIQFKTPFYTFVAESMRSRIDTLVEMLEIDDRIVEGYMFPDDINDSINFQDINDKIQKRKKDSIRFLKQAFDIQDV